MSSNPSLTPEFLDERQLAAWLGLSRTTPRLWRRAGEGPAFIRVGRSIRYRKSDVENWLSARTVGRAG
jgi:excisionase family DNA binding protein